jgi:hypothetical protein
VYNYPQFFQISIRIDRFHVLNAKSFKNHLKSIPSVEETRSMDEGVLLGLNKQPLSMEIRSDWGKVFDEKVSAMKKKRR